MEIDIKGRKILKLDRSEDRGNVSITANRVELFGLFLEILAGRWIEKSTDISQSIYRGYTRE